MKGWDKKQPTIAEKRATVLVAEWEEILVMQKQSIKTVEKFVKCPFGAVSWLATPPQRIVEVEKFSKVLTDRLVVMQKQVAESAKANDDAFMWLFDRLEGMRLLEREALVLKSPLSTVEKARGAAVLDLNSRSREVRALRAHVRMLWGNLNLLKRIGTSHCDLEASTCKVADAQSNTTDRDTK